MNHNIDIVIAWVDGNDVSWQREKEKFAGSQSSLESINPARFRDWGTLKYVLRSIEQNMPWVNRIFLVTAGQQPSWLKETDKVKLVDHKKFIPEEFLPTFSSHVIEVFLHRIPNLSEQFIYFNDDTVILKKAEPTDFFVAGKPADIASLHIHAVKKSLMIHQIANNDISIINEHFEFKTVLKERRWQWFNPKYGLKRNLKTLLLSQTPRFPGIEQLHMPQAYLKSIFKEVWDKEPELLTETASHRFRHKNDINQWLFRDWQLASGNFTPVRVKNRGLMIDFEKGDELAVLKLCEQALSKKNYLMLCINDGDSIYEYDIIQSRVQNVLDVAFPVKSTCEK